MNPHPLSRAISTLGIGLSGAAVVTYGKSAVSFSGPVLLGVVLIIAVAIIVIIYRLTSTVDLVALVRAWRGDKNEEESSPAQLEEEE